MKACVYSYWLSTPVLPGARAGAAAMAAYAKTVGADFRFDCHSPYMTRHGVDARWFDKLRPAYDPTFAAYDKVLVVDSDVFPVDGITANIFDEPCDGFGMVEEPDQPAFRERFPSSLFSRTGDERWALFVRRAWGAMIPFDDHGRPRTWNAGVILLTRDALGAIPSLAVQPQGYVDAAKREGLPHGYTTEQAYLNLLAFSGWVRFTPLALEWNRQLHHLGDGTTYDRRTADTKFVHVQFRGADHHDAAWHHALVNRPNPKLGDAQRSP